MYKRIIVLEIHMCRLKVEHNIFLYNPIPKRMIDIRPIRTNIYLTTLIILNDQMIIFCPVVFIVDTKEMNDSRKTRTFFRNSTIS